MSSSTAAVPISEADFAQTNQICRVCLVEHLELFQIFEDKKPTDIEVSLVQIFNECTQYKVELNDDLPQQVCGKCRDAAHTAFQFKQQTEEAYRTLRGLRKDFKLFTEAVDRIDCATQTDAEQMHACELCTAKFLDGYALRQHRREEHFNDMKRCKVCNAEYTTLRQLKAHLMRLHPEQIDKSSTAKCYLCQKQFSRKDHLHRHIRSIHKQCDNVAVMEPLIKIEEQEEEHIQNMDGKININSMFEQSAFDTNEDEETSDDEILAKRFTKETKYEDPEIDPIFVEDNANLISEHADILESLKPEENMSIKLEINNDENDVDSDEHLENNNVVTTKRGRPCKTDVISPDIQENRCPQCKRSFTRRCHLRRHMLTHLSEKPFPCTHCEKRFTRSDHLKTHIKNVHRNKEFQCDQCKCAFISNDLLMRHMELRHGEVPNAHKIYDCDMCEKKFSTKKYLVKHKLLHTHRIFACKHCDETYTDRKTFRDHERTHTSDRNFLCSVCGESFVRVDYLRIHMRRHTGEKPYKCQFCGKGFPRATDVKMHERYHTGTKPSVCNLCGKAFHRAYNLTIHMRTHTGERPYKCDQCAKSFAQSNDLKAHIRRHTGERFKCDYCDAAFLQMYVLRQHVLNTHGIQIESNTGRLKKFLNIDGNQTVIPLQQQQQVQATQSAVLTSQSVLQQLQSQQQHLTMPINTHTNELYNINMLNQHTL